MPVNKHSLIRYKVLDRCLRNFHRRYYIEDLIEACNDALYDYTGKHECVQRRQIFNDLNTLEESLLFGARIDRIKDGRKVYYRYHYKGFSIEDTPFDDDDMDKMKEALLSLRRFKGLPSFEWVEEFLVHLEGSYNMQTTDEEVIEFEHNPYLEGIDFLEPLLTAAINHQPQQIVYQAYGKPEVEWDIHPYFLKQYNNRWFLFGLNDKNKKIYHIPLDRIKSTKESKVRFIPNTGIDFKQDYFADIIGVSIEKDTKLEKIVLQFDEKRFPYVLSKPIHESQTVIDKETRKVKIEVMPNKELEALLLSFGNQVEVLEPENMRTRIKEKVRSMMSIYGPVQKECTDDV